MNTIFTNAKTSWLKKFALIISIACALFVPNMAFAENPDITLVETWKNSNNGAEYFYWVNNNGFNTKQKRRLTNRWNNWLVNYPTYKNKINNFINNHGGPTPGYVGSGAVAGGGGGGGGGSVAGGLALANAPLFISQSVDPNIHFLLDDSGSMKWETMVGTEVSTYNSSSGVPYINNSYRYYLNNWGSSSHNSIIPPFASFNDAWMAKSVSANQNYYNPITDYKPWPGVDAGGNPLYKDADPHKVLKNPNNPSGTSLDLTDNFNFKDSNSATTFVLYLPTYYIWVDSDFDGVLEPTDVGIEVEIKPANTGLFPTNRTYTEELQNFANWFQYYRSREYAAKFAIGSVINDTYGTRMGLDLINARHVVNTKSMDNSTNKLNLLKSIYAIKSSGWTHLRRALRRVGDMFKGESNYYAGQGAITAPSPILSAADGGACQQNFQIVMTDGYWNGNSPGVGNADGDDNTKYDGDGKWVSGTIGNVDNKYFADSQKSTLADVAMYFYENDISNLPDIVPTTVGVDEASHQHLVTYSIAFGINGTLDVDTLDPSAAGFSWPTVAASSATSIDDLVHAAYNGRGEYLNAAHPGVLAESLTEIIENISERKATAAAVSINSAKLTTDTVIYIAEFNTHRWQGDILAYKIIPATGKLQATPQWEAKKILDARQLNFTTTANAGDDNRQIITYNRSNIAGSRGVPFEWNKLSLSQQSDLLTLPNGNVSAVSEGQGRLNFIRGDRTNEKLGFGFRERASRLADIVNSGPVYVSNPDLNWPDFSPFPTGVGEKYSDFKLSQKSRSGMIYVGSNDGLLHAFEEGDGSVGSGGREAFAYIPNTVYSNGAGEGLHYLTDPKYSHKYYNDLTPTISDIYINAGSSKQWNTVLLGGLRGGGRGIYALNITDPLLLKESNAASIALWEFTNTDDAELGLTYSKPQIALANNGKWVAIFGNGYNNTGNGEAYLYIVDIEAGIDGWQAGDYIKIPTGSGSAAAINGLSTPSLADIDGDGDVDRVYAGDLKGQMWVFDISSSSSGTWGLASASPLFTTVNNQAITAKPALSFHPTQSYNASNKPNIMVYFGSGLYLQEADKTDTSKNYFYGVWDNGNDNLNNTDLIKQSFDSSYSDRVLSKNSVDYSTKSGWYIDLDISGERSVTSAVVRFGAVFFNTFIPTSSACTSGGGGYKMAVDSATGGALDEAAFDSNGDSVVDSNDTTSNGTTTSTVTGIKQNGFLPKPVFIEDLSFTGKTSIKVSKQPNVQTGRMAWQELLK